MTIICRGGFIFLTWVGDHTPRHVHVYRNGRFIVKWDLDGGLPMAGRPEHRVIKLIQELDAEGKL